MLGAASTEYMMHYPDHPQPLMCYLHSPFLITGLQCVLRYSIVPKVIVCLFEHNLSQMIYVLLDFPFSVANVLSDVNIHVQFASAYNGRKKCP